MNDSRSTRVKTNVQGHQYKKPVPIYVRKRKRRGIESERERERMYTSTIGVQNNRRDQ